MNRFQSVVKMHLRDKLSWFYLPWIILLSSFSVNLLIAAFNEEPFQTGGLMSIYIYMFVVGIVVLPQTFPFALGFSIRRKDYYWGTVVSQVIASAVSSLVLMLFTITESSLIKDWGVGLSFFRIPHVTDGNPGTTFWIGFALLIFMFASGNLFGAFYRRFGKSGFYTGAAVMIILLTLMGYWFTANGWWADIWNWIEDKPASVTVLALQPLTLLYLLLSYIMLRKATV